MPITSRPVVACIPEGSSSERPYLLPLLEAGFPVRIAASFTAALDLAAGASLVLLDGWFPGAAAFCERLRSDPITIGVPILLLDDRDPASLPLSPLSERGPGGEGPDACLPRSASPQQVVAQARLLDRLRQAEDASRTSHARLQHILDHAPVAVSVKDEHGCYYLVNRCWETYFQRRREQVLGRTVFEVFPADRAEHVAERYRAVLESGSPLEYEEVVPGVDVSRTYLKTKFALFDGHQPYAVCGIALDVTDRRNAQQEQARRAADVSVAHKVQQKLFPAANSPLLHEAAQRGFDIGGASFPVDEVGGDYYDYFRLDEHRLAVAIGDVSGHGVGPALLMASARAYLHAHARAEDSPGDVLALINRLLINDMEGDRYITLLLARLDMQRCSLVYASAGHATGYILDAHGEVKHHLDSTGVPLGICAAETFPTSAEIRLASGDILVLLTDGIVEAPDPHRHTFTPGRVLDLVRVYRQASARAIAGNLFHSVRAFAQNHPQLDDITATVIKIA
jgi:PAS domain S-box-containing protein